MLERDLSSFPELRTERLVLSAVTRYDAPALFRIRSYQRVMEHIGRPMATTIKDASDVIDRLLNEQTDNNGITWAIAQDRDPALIGTIGYYRLKKEHYRGEVGYALHSDHWRNGIMTEALTAVLQCGSRRSRFHSIEAGTDPRSTASNAVLERCGFVREGSFKRTSSGMANPGTVRSIRYVHHARELRPS